MGKPSTNTTTSSSTPNPIVQGAATDIAGRASNAINTLTPQQLVPDPTPRMNQGWDLTERTTGSGDPSQVISSPYFGRASDLYDQATQPLYNTVGMYESPYIRDVVNATQGQFDYDNAIQQQGVVGNAVAKGAWGGDRSAVAQGITAYGQQKAQAPVIAGLYNQGYNTALSAAEAQAWQREQAAGGLLALGTGALSSDLTAAQALYGAGQQQYGQIQARNTVPLQIPQYEAGLLGTISGSLGGTSSTTTPAASPLSQIAGLGIGGIGLLGATGGFGSNGYLSNLFSSPDPNSTFNYSRRGGRIGHYAPGGAVFGINAPNSFAFNSADPFDFATAPVPHATSGMSNPLAPIVTQTQSQSGGGGGILGDILGAGTKIAGLFLKDGGVVRFASGGNVSDDDSGFLRPRGGFAPLVFRSGSPSRGGGFGIPAPPAAYRPDAATQAITPAGIMGTLKDTGAFGDKGWMKDAFAGGGGIEYGEGEQRYQGLSPSERQVLLEKLDQSGIAPRDQALDDQTEFRRMLGGDNLTYPHSWYDPANVAPADAARLYKRGFAGGGGIFVMPSANTGAVAGDGGLLDARLGEDDWGDYRHRDLPRYATDGEVVAPIPPRLADLPIPDLPDVAPSAGIAPPPSFGPGSSEEGVTLRHMAPQARTAEARRAELQRQNAYADAVQGGFQGTIQDFAGQAAPPSPSKGIAPKQQGRSEADIIASESGGRPYVGYGGADLSNAPLDENGFPIWAGKMGPAGISHAAGKYQFQPGTWAEGAKALGISDFSPESQKRVYDWTRAKYGDTPWAASAGDPSAGKRGIARDRMAGITAADAGGGDAPSGTGIVPPRATTLSSSQMDDLIKSVKPNPWMALAAAGFGMAAGRSPQAMQNIGSGALEGLKMYEAQRLGQPKLVGEAAEAGLKAAQAYKVYGAQEILARPTSTTPQRVGAIEKMVKDAGPSANAQPSQVARPDGSVVPVASAENPAPVTAPQGAGANGAAAASPAGGVPPVPPIRESDTPGVQQIKAEAQRLQDLIWTAPDTFAAQRAYMEELQKLPEFQGAVAAARSAAEVPAHISEAQQKVPIAVDEARQRAAIALQNAGPLKAAEVGETMMKYRGADGRQYEGKVKDVAAGTAYGMRAATGPIDPRTGQPAAGTGIAGPVTEFEPGEASERQEQGTQAGKDRVGINAAADSARTNSALLTSIDENAKKFVTGPLNEIIGEFNRYANVVNPKKYGESVAARENFMKDQGVFTRQAAHDVTSRAGIQEVLFIQKSLPTPDMSEKGIHQVVAEFRGLDDYKVAKAQALQQWMGGHQGFARGFEDWWGASAPVTPYAYIVARMAPDQRQALYRDMGRTKEGRDHIEKIVKEQTYAQQHGWMGLQQ